MSQPHWVVVQQPPGATPIVYYLGLIDERTVRRYADLVSRQDGYATLVPLRSPVTRLLDHVDHLQEGAPRRNPGFWPPQPGDIWEDAQGYRWTCVPPSAIGGNPDTRYLVRLDEKADDSADYIQETRGPLTLVYRPDVKKDEEPF